MNKKVTVNYIYNLTYQLLAIVLPFITTPYISRTFRPDDIGIFNYTYSVISVFVLVASLGSHAYAQKEIAFAGEDTQVRNTIFWSIFSIRVVSTIIVTLFFVVLLFLDETYRILYIIEFFFILANMLDISWCFQGMGDFKKTAVRSIIIKVLSVIAIFTLVKSENDLKMYTFINSFSTFLNAIVLWRYVPRVIGRASIQWSSIKIHIKPIMMLFLPMAAIHVYTSVDKVFLGWLSTESEVGFYSQADKIVKILMTIITSLGLVLLPHIASMIKEKNMKNVRTQVKDAIHFVIALGFPMVVGLICISPYFVPWFFGPGYNSSILLIQVLSILILIVGLSSVTGQAVLIPLNKQKIYTISIMCGMFINIIVNFTLIPFLNSMGAVIGTIAAELIVGLIQQTVVLKALKLRLSEEIKDNISCISSGAIMGSVLILIKPFFQSSFLSLFIYAAIGVLAYTMCMILFKDRFVTQFSRVLMKKK